MAKKKAVEKTADTNVEKSIRKAQDDSRASVIKQSATEYKKTLKAG